MRFFLLLAIASVSLLNPVLAMEDDFWTDSTPEKTEAMYQRATQLKPMEFKDVGFTKGMEFSLYKESAYIECSEANTDFDKGFSARSFTIKRKEKIIEVGSIGVIYHPRDRVVDISTIEVLKEHRRKGYGESALRTVLSVYRGNHREVLNRDQSYLDFDYFTLTVFKDEASAPARALFKKIGFEDETDGELGWKMRLQR